MVVFRLMIVFACLAFISSALPFSNRVSLEPVVPVPDGWEVVGVPDPRAEIELTFSVKQQNVDKLEQLFHAVSNPKDPRYGQHLSQAAVHELVAPLPEHIAVVRSFLDANNATHHFATPNGDFITAIVPIETAESILQTRFHLFQHPHHPAPVSRATEHAYTLPESVAQSLDFVAPVHRFPPVRMPLAQDSGLGANTPKGLRELYSVNDKVGSVAENKQAVTAFLGQHFSPRDLNLFYTELYPAGKGTKVVSKGDDPTGVLSGVEAMLDIEYITAMGTHINSEFWGFKGKSPDNPDNEPFVKWLTLLSSTSDADVPKVFSSSYGENEDSASLAYANRLNTEFMKAGARGISLLFASGDSGAAGTSGCNDGRFVPQWPSGSPYVTAVGGTTYSTGSNEVGVGLSSGGFSLRWPMPDYQAEAVNGYLTTASGLPDPRAYNSSGRAFPDISAQAAGFLVVYDMLPPMPVSGTSAACPTVSGIVALLNDVRLAAGKSTLGFLNPLIYQNIGLFNDITEGRQNGCGISSDGFPLAKGWDPVTGAGTPNFSNLAQLVVAEL